MTNYDEDRDHDRGDEYGDQSRGNEYGDADRARGNEYDSADRARENEYDADHDREHTDVYDPNPSEGGKWVSALIAVLGLWMILQVFLFDLTMSQFWNDLLVGGLLLAVGGYNYSQRSSEETGSMAAAAIAALVGVWLLAAPFVLGPGTEEVAVETMTDLAFWNDIVVGLLAFVLGAYSAYKARELGADSRREVAR